MDDNSWLVLRHQDQAHRLPQDLAARDGFGARDCGWVEQMRPFIRQFCPEGGLVLDPFCGFGTTLLAAHLEGRRGIGVELETARAGLAAERMARAGADAQQVLAGSILDAAPSLPRVDLILTNVPYFGCRWPAGGALDGQLYGTDTYAAFLNRMYDVFRVLKPVLRENGFLVVMAENLRIGEQFVPMAWDIARILAERFDLVDERILLYERARRQVEPMAARNNRAHEHALIARQHPRSIDLDGAWRCVRELAAEVDELVVYGSFARWLAGEALERTPSDVDLLVPNDVASITRVVRWLEAHGFDITRWGAPLSHGATAAAAPGAHYVRARRLLASGESCVIDVCFEDALLDHAQAAAMARRVDGVRVLPSTREGVR